MPVHATCTADMGASTTRTLSRVVSFVSRSRGSVRADESPMIPTLPLRPARAQRVRKFAVFRFLLACRLRIRIVIPDLIISITIPSRGLLSLVSALVSASSVLVVTFTNRTICDQRLFCYNKRRGAHQFGTDDRGQCLLGLAILRSCSAGSCSPDLNASLHVLDKSAASRLVQMYTLPPLWFLAPKSLDFRVRLLDVGLWRTSGLVLVLCWWNVLMAGLPVEVCSVAAWLSEVVAATWSALAFATQRSAPPASTFLALVAPPHLAPSSGRSRDRGYAVLCGRLLLGIPSSPSSCRSTRG
ncbi:hypothetical protein GGX14DRAFT_396698 [Mycena pura]|uniref:Uncharacterized protein n=1 Tax=Mycena pura TaxID=153505 RepID=A0AAD6VGW4_9AGAR|nr:hypothetical protein GGX14DRAFT_396698 [Mycena pura]